MKKLFITGVIAVLAFSSVAHAELELSGNVTTLAAYQNDNGNAANTAASGVGLGAGGITQGDLRWTPTASANHFGFAVPQAELDVENEYGENIMARVDVDFIDLGTPGATAVLLEQAYVTANIAVGNGLEFLVGKFNVPFGLESVDRHENVFSTYTPGRVFVVPTQVLGAKLYYEFNDHWSFDLGAVNSLNHVLTGNSAIPSGLFRLGANWGDEDRLSFVHLGAAVGPEHSTAVGLTSTNSNLDYFGNLWGNFAFGSYWDLGWEGLYRRTQSATGGSNQSAWGGQLYVVYQPSDVWTVQLRGAGFNDVDPIAGGGGSGASTTGSTWGGFEGLTYSGTLGATYQITDGAQVKLEYRYDMAQVTGAADGQFHTGVAEFGYTF